MAFGVNYGMYISASGATTAMYRMDVLANNLANMNTAGFKPDLAVVRQRDAARVEDGLGHLPSNELLERLGAGVHLAPNRIDFAPGSLRASGNPLDLAIEGNGFFLARDDADPSGDRVRLTRDGRLTLNARGRLVMTASGMPVLGEGNTPIELRPGVTPEVRSDGTILQNGQTVARLALVDVRDRAALEKVGHGLFRAPASALASRGRADGLIKAYAVEESGTNEIRTIMDLTSVGREIESNIGMIQQQNRLSERAINVLGQVT